MSLFLFSSFCVRDCLKAALHAAPFQVQHDRELFENTCNPPSPLLPTPPPSLPPPPPSLPRSCYVAFNPEKEEGRLGPPVDYRLPDGEIIKLGAERFQAPEALFRPELIGSECPGVHECLYYSLMKSDRDLRTVLYKQIVLAGGSTMYQGYGDRLLNEVRKLSPEATKITISAPPQRKYSTWVGGSILASLATFNSMVSQGQTPTSTVSPTRPTATQCPPIATHRHPSPPIATHRPPRHGPPPPPPPPPAPPPPPPPPPPWLQWVTREDYQEKGASCLKDTLL